MIISKLNFKNKLVNKYNKNLIYLYNKGLKLQEKKINKDRAFKLY